MALPKNPINPPPSVMLPELRAPDHTQIFWRELVSREDPRFYNNAPIKRGVLYKDLVGSDVRISIAYPNLYFCRETVPLGSTTVAGMTQADYVVWEWSTSPDAESTFNAEVSYLADGDTNPVYARQYMIRRDVYDATPKINTSKALDALLGVLVTNVGKAYTKAHAEFECGGEAGIDFVISDGQIISGIVTDEGRFWNPDSKITIVGDGSDATCTPIIQAPEAILTSQKKIELPDNDPMSHEFVKVLRVYETLPGPWVPFTRYDDDLGPVQGKRRAVENIGQVGGIVTPTTKTNYEGRDGSSVVLIEIVETWTDGTGVPGDPLNGPFPIMYWSTWSDERGIVQHTSQMMASLYAGAYALLIRTGIVGASSLKRTWYEPYPDNPFLQKRLTEEWTEPYIQDQELIHEFGGAICNIVESTATPGFQSPVHGLMVVSSKTKTKSPNEQTLTTVTAIGEEWPTLVGYHTDETTGIGVRYTKQVIPAGTPYPGTKRVGHCLSDPLELSCCILNTIQGPFIEDTPYDFDKTIRIISDVDLDTLPDPQCWPINYPVNLPPTLLAVQAYWTDFGGKSLNASQNSGIFFNTVGVSSGSNGGVAVVSKNGFRGYLKGRLYRAYSYGPPDPGNVPIPLVIEPSSGSVILCGTSTSTNTGKSSDGGISFEDGFHTTAQVHHIQDHLVGNICIQGFTVNTLGGVSGSGSSIGGQNLLLHRSPPRSSSILSPPVVGVSTAGIYASMQVQIFPSNPPILPYGDEAIWEVKVIEHPFNVWEMQVYYVTLPPPGEPFDCS